jgi:hypothetical protein
MRVADVGREELDIAPRRFVAEIGDQRRDDVRRPLIDGDLGLLNRRQKMLLRCRQNSPFPAQLKIDKRTLSCVMETGKGRGFHVILNIKWCIR